MRVQQALTEEDDAWEWVGGGGGWVGWWQVNLHTGQFLKEAAWVTHDILTLHRMFF